MKILHCVEFYYPSVGGAQEVVRQLSEHLVRLGHDVTVATTKLDNRNVSNHNGVRIQEFDISGKAVVGFKGKDVEKYKKFLIDSDFDIIMTYAAQQWTTDLMFSVLDKIKAKKVIVPCGYSAFYDPAYTEYFKNLPKYLRKFNSSIYLAENYRDITFARKHELKNINIIPNGADEKEFKSVLTKEGKQKVRQMYGVKGIMIMTVANYTGEKGHAELLSVFKRLPMPKVTLVSAGTISPGVGYYDAFKSHAERINKNRKFPGKKVIMVDGSKRNEVRRLLKTADIFVFLSNVEASPLVLFEAAAAGVPFVSTPAGNSSEIARWMGSGIIVKSRSEPNGIIRADIKDSVWQISKLALNPFYRRRLGRTGRESWQNKYTWEVISKRYETLYKELIKS